MGRFCGISCSLLLCSQTCYLWRGLACECQWEPASYTKEVKEITQLLLFCLTAISAIVLTMLYSSIIVYLYRQKNKLHLETDIVRERAKRNWKITLMLVIVVVIFYVIWIPYNLASFTLFVTPGVITLPDNFVWIAGWFLPMLYPVANPVVYYIFNDKYRQGFKKLLCCGWRSKDKRGNCSEPASSTSWRAKTALFMTPGKPTLLSRTSNSSSNEEVTL